MRRRTHDRPRFFIEGVHGSGDVVELTGADARKARLVLRCKTGDPLQVSDSGGNTFAATATVDGAVVTARLDEQLEKSVETGREIWLYQAIPKGAKMDFVVEKATELGVARIVPVQTERTIAAAASDAKVERWNRLARTAAAQCGRSRVPAVDEPRRWDDLFASGTIGDGLILFPWELAEPVPLRESLPPLLGRPGRIGVLIGPEGGISHEEAATATAAGVQPISLGPRIFRTETAGLVVVSALLYALGDL